MSNIPNYRDLPYNDVLGMHCSWGVFGPDDQLGTLNRITPETVLSAAAEVRAGESYELGLPLHWPDPPIFKRSPYRHEIFALGRTGYDDRLDNFYPQGSSQWDGFRHIRAREFGMYGGMTDAPQASDPRLGIQAWAEKGIATRGILLDVAKALGPYDPFEDTRVSADDLQRVADQQGVEVRSGDVLLIRFGWTAAYKELDHDGRVALSEREYGRWSGLLADEAMAEALWDWGIAAVAADNPSLECAPGSPEIGSLHRRILPLLGIPIGEFFDLDALADACATDGHYSFLFCSAPLPLVGGVGSPSNAVAIR